MQQAMLTTIDNPYDPFDEYDQWHAHDMWLGYRTAEFLARVAVTSDELSEPDYWLAIEQAIDNIVRDNITGTYKKVVRQVDD